MLLLKNVVSNITALYDEYSLPEIEKSFNLVMKQIKDDKKTEREISRLVVDKLNKLKATENATKTKDKQIPDMNVSTMRDFINHQEE